MTRVFGALVGWCLLNVATGAIADDSNKAFDQIAKCTGYLALKTETGASVTDADERVELRLDVAGNNLQFFILAGYTAGYELEMIDETIEVKLQEEFEDWVSIMKVARERADMMPYGLVRAYEIECFDGGSIYKTAREVLVAAGLEQEAEELLAGTVN